MATRGGLFDPELNRKSLPDVEANRFGILDPDFVDTTGAAANPFKSSTGMEVAPRGGAFSIALRTFVIAVPLLLIGKDQVYGAPGQVPTYSQPNPIVRTANLELRTWTQNLLPTTLGVVQAPFSQTDWPVPRGSTPSVELKTYVDGSETWLLKDQFFGAPGQPPNQSDWPNPRSATPAIELRTDVDPLEFWLLQDSFFGPPGKAPSFDWPNPRGPVFPITLRTLALGLQQSTLQPSTAPPIVPIDWPNPIRRVVVPTGNLTHLFYYIQDQTVPYAQTDWPNPSKGPGYPVDLRTWLVNLQQSTLSIPPVVLPYNQFDWPNPRGPIYPVALRTLLDGRKTYFVDAPAFNQFDWPVPKGARAAIDLRTWLIDLLQGTLAPGPKPFLLSEWPVPKGYAYPLELRTFLNAVELNLLGKDTFYGAPGEPPPNYDWPVPKGKPFLITLRHLFNMPALSNIPSVLATLQDFFIVDAQGRWFVVEAEGRLHDAGLYLPAALTSAVGMWRLDDAGASMNDLVGTNDGTATSITNGQIGPLIDGSAAIAVTGAAASKVTVPDAVNLHLTSQVSLGCWVKADPTMTGATREIWAFGAQGGFTTKFTTRLDTTLVIGGVGVSRNVFVPTVLGLWFYLLTTYDGATLSFYINGVLADSVPASGALNLGTSGFTLGNGPSNSGWKGLIKDAVVYGRALTAAEVLNIYTAAQSTLGGFIVPEGGREFES